MTEKLAALGVRVAIGHAAENVGDAQLVVFTSAAHGDNPEIVEAQRRGIPVIKRAEMVARLMEGRYSIAVAGTHGKTTTSGLIAHMLVEAKLDPTYLIGGEVRSLGTNAAPGEGKYIVVEADEYDRAFLSYTPDVAVVTNIEPDHLDIYGTVEEMAAAFAQFMASAPIDGHVIACADSPRVRQTVAAGGIEARDVQTYGDRRAGGLAGERRHAARERADASTSGAMGGRSGRSRSALPGRHNVSNALAGIAAGSTIGIETAVMQSALATYRGAQRRFEYVGEARGRDGDGRLRASPDRSAHRHDRGSARTLPRPAHRRCCSSRTRSRARRTCWTSGRRASRARTRCTSRTRTRRAKTRTAGLSGADLAAAVTSPQAVVRRCVRGRRGPHRGRSARRATCSSRSARATWTASGRWCWSGCGGDDAGDAGGNPRDAYGP